MHVSVKETITLTKRLTAQVLWSGTRRQNHSLQPLSSINFSVAVIPGLFPFNNVLLFSNCHVIIGSSLTKRCLAPGQDALALLRKPVVIVIILSEKNMKEGFLFGFM